MAAASGLLSMKALRAQVNDDERPSFLIISIFNSLAMHLPSRRHELRIAAPAGRRRDGGGPFFRIST
jgi:hypothetical protein